MLVVKMIILQVVEMQKQYVKGGLDKQLTSANSIFNLQMQNSHTPLQDSLKLQITGNRTLGSSVCPSKNNYQW